MSMLSRKDLNSNFGVKKSYSISTSKEGRTKQSFKNECDINSIMKRFEKTGQLPALIKKNPKYGDFSNVPDYQTALNLVTTAKTQFAALNAEQRARFGQDVEQFLAFMSDSKNEEEMVKLGLIAPAEDVPPPAADPATPAPAVPAAPVAAVK